MVPPCIQRCRGDTDLLRRYAHAILKYYYTFDSKNYADVYLMLVKQGVQLNIDDLATHFQCREMDFCDEMMQRNCDLIYNWYNRLKVCTRDVKRIVSLDGVERLVVRFENKTMNLPMDDNLTSELRAQYMTVFDEYLDLDARRTEDKRGLKYIIDFWLKNAEKIKEENYGEDSENQWVRDVAYDYLQGLRPTDDPEYALLDNFCYYRGGKGYCHRNNLVRYIEGQTGRKVSLHKLTRILSNFATPKRLRLGGRRYSFYEFDPNPDLLEESKEEGLIETTQSD